MDRYPDQPELGPYRMRNCTGVGMCPPMRLHGVYWLGSVDAGSDWRLAHPQLHDLRLQAMITGSMQVWMDGRWRCITAGDLIWQPRGDRIWQSGLTDSRHVVIIVPSQSPTGRILAGRPAGCLQGDTAAIGVLVDEILREQRGCNAAAVTGALLEALMHLLARHLRGAGIPENLAKAWEAVSAQPARPWTTVGVARILGASDETLRRLTRQHYGRSARDHLQWLRLRHAADLLAQPGLGIAQVAARCGYADPCAFTRAFRRTLGTAPSSWSQQSPTRKRP